MKPQKAAILEPQTSLTSLFGLTKSMIKIIERLEMGVV
jgi:hypothetical protein